MSWCQSNFRTLTLFGFSPRFMSNFSDTMELVGHLFPGFEAVVLSDRL